MPNFIMPTPFKNVQMANQVGIRISQGVIQRITHPGLGAKVNDPLKLMFSKQLGNSIAIGQIQFDKLKCWPISQHVEPCLFQADSVIIIQVVDTDNLMPHG
ncbi:hypothetical protein D3C79_487210 [compost metagenome]